MKKFKDGQILTADDLNSLVPHVEYGSITVGTGTNPMQKETVTFKRPFSQPPLIFLTRPNPPFADQWVYTGGITKEAVEIASYRSAGNKPTTINWLAIEQ